MEIIFIFMAIIYVINSIEEKEKQNIALKQEF
jgi:hypothetical protein